MDAEQPPSYEDLGDTKPVPSPPQPLNLRIQLFGKHRGGDNQNYERFRAFVRRSLGRQASRWKICVPPSRRPGTEDVFSVEAVAIFNVQGQTADNNDVQNLLAELRRARPSSFFLENLTSALLFRVYHDDARNNEVVAVDYLDHSVYLRPRFDISTGEPSWFNAAAETTLSVVPLCLLVYVCIRLYETHTNHHGGPTREEQEDLRFITGTASFIHGLSDLPWRREEIRTIAEGRRQLAATLPSYTGLLAQAQVKRHNLSFQSDEGGLISVEQACETFQTISHLSNNVERTAAILDDIAPLLDEEYSDPKLKLTLGVAVTGCVVAVGVAALWFFPGTWAAAGTLVVNNGGVSAFTAACGVGVAGVSGTRSMVIRNQRNLITSVRASLMNFNNAKTRLFTFLVLCLYRVEGRSISEKNLTDICKSLGLQSDLVRLETYQVAAFQTAWEEFTHSFQEFEDGIRKLSQVIE